MKANEAPERLYLSQERDGDGCYVDLMWHKHPYENIENIQYVRKDSFIEKACEFIAENMNCNGYTLQTKAKFIKDFKKYMEN